LFPLLLGVFALDVFGHGQGFWRTILALLIHLTPSLVLTGALLMAWRWLRIGAAIYAALGAVYIITAWGRCDLAAFYFIAGPALLISVLLLLDWHFPAR
jgi:hypothetical protein